MKVTFNIPANGYRSEVTNANETGAYPEWVDAKFGGRIRELISDDFTLDIQPGFFTVDFTYEDDGIAFLNTFGGRVID